MFFASGPGPRPAVQISGGGGVYLAQFDNYVQHTDPSPEAGILGVPGGSGEPPLASLDLVSTSYGKLDLHMRAQLENSSLLVGSANLRPMFAVCHGISFLTAQLGCFSTCSSFVFLVWFQGFRSFD